MTSAGLPHSDTHDSMPACGSSWLFAAYRVLHRLLAPRHPPYALVRLISSFYSILCHVLLLVKSLLQLSLFKEVFLSSSVCSFQGTLEVAIAPSKLNDASRCDRP